MKKLLLAILLVAPRVHAQPGEAQPTEAKEGEPAEDPTQHFNFTTWSYSGKDEYGGPLGDGFETDAKGVKHEEEPMPAPFVLLLLNFGVLLVILGKYGGPAATQLAKERHDHIKTALDDAAKLRDQARAKLAEYETRIKDVDAEVQKLMDGIRADAEADKARILDAAKAQAEHMKRDAETRIAAEIELARTLLTREVAAAATTATEKVLRDKTTADDQKRLVSTFISSIDVRSQATGGR